jgi:hypothetical protein
MNINQKEINVNKKITSTQNIMMSITLKEYNKFEKELEYKENLAVLSPTQVTWIENLVNADGNLQDIYDVYPEANTDEIAHVVYEGIKNKRINSGMGNSFLGETFFDIPAPTLPQADTIVQVTQSDTMVHIPVPQATQPHHNPNITIQPDFPAEFNWAEWVIPIVFTGIVLVILYDIWRKQRKTPPADGEGTSSKVSSTSSSNDSSKGSSSTSSAFKFSLDIFLETVPLLFLCLSSLYLSGCYVSQG